MGLREDLERFREVGEERREDLKEFITYGDLGRSTPGSIKIPIKVVDLPSFEYDQLDKGGVGQGQGGTPDVGQPVGQPQPGDGDGEDGEPGEESGEHEYVMDPEEFAEELDEELGLDLDPKGKTVEELVEGDFTDVTRTGPSSTLDFKKLFKKGLQRGLARDYDEEYVREAAKVDASAREIHQWLLEPVRADGDIAPRSAIRLSLPEVEAIVDEVGDEHGYWDSFEEMHKNTEYEPTSHRIGRVQRNIQFHPDDERYRAPEIIEKKRSDVVVVNIRDVSGSMREKKRELVERTFTPLDWYLTGKYDNAEFVYIAHDTEAWETEREEFFGITSGGGTKISSAYELAKEILDEQYPWAEWNRYVFAAGDSENSSNDTTNNVIPLMEEIPANMHAYVEAQPGKDGFGQARNASHAREVHEYAEDNGIEDWPVTHVGKPTDVPDAIYDILSTEGGDE